MPINADKPHLWKSDVECSIDFLLFLCGYFEPGYLGYEAAEGIDWVWEHRPNDFQALLGSNSKKKVTAVKETASDYSVAKNSVQEINRAEAQEEVDSLKGAAERNKLGQFSTPFLLADQMVKHALAFLEPDIPLRFLEPAVGTGVFFSALLRNTKAGRIESATGCEIDPAYGDVCTASPDEVKRKCPGLWSYFEEGVAQGLPARHLCSQREAWYFQEKREPAPFIVSYMGRSRDQRSGPL